MAAVDQAPRGLLVPAWSPKCERPVVVVAPLPAGEDCVGLTADEVAARRKVSRVTALRWLLEGELPPVGGGRPGPKHNKATREWIAKHVRPGATIAEAALLWKCKAETIRRWIELNLPPVMDRQPGARKKPAELVEGKGYRGPKPAKFIRDWVKRRCPEDLQNVPIRRIAERYGVTDVAVRNWAKSDLDPRPGGYPGGVRKAKSALHEAQKAARRAHRKKRAARRAAPPPAPVALTPERRERLKSAFIAELHARRPPAARLTRIFTAEIRA